MKRNPAFNPRRGLALSLLFVAMPLTHAAAQDKAKVPAGGTVNVTISTTAAAPPVTIVLHERHGHVTPCKGKCTHTGGGLIDVAQPSPDTVVITMSGAVVGNALMKFDLDQCFALSFDDPKVKRAKLTVEGRVVGLLRGEAAGCAEISEACAHVTAGHAELAGFCLPPHSVCKCENVSVNDHAGPKCMPGVPCCPYTLNQTFCIGAQMKCALLKRPSAEFAPESALDPLWISYFDPFHGVKKDSFGFQVTLKVAQETDDTNGDNGNNAEKVPSPKEKK